MSQKFSSLGFVLNEADLSDMDLSGGDALTSENKDEVYSAFIRIIPSLLLRPTSVSEGGAAISRAQRADIEAFYKGECARLGIDDTLSPKVTFL